MPAWGSQPLEKPVERQAFFMEKGLTGGAWLGIYLIMTKTNNTRKTTRIDLHVHTRGSDGHGTPKQIAQAAVDAGLDGICLTDHHSTHNAENLKVATACRAMGLVVIHGSEYSTAQGHLLVYGVDFEELQMGFYPEMQDVIDEVNRRGGAAIPAHPYKGYKHALRDDVKNLRGVRAYEVANGQVTYQCSANNTKAVKAAESKNKLGTGGSDAHWVSGIGLTYTEFQGRITNEKEFLNALKRGQFRAITSRKRVAQERKSWFTVRSQTKRSKFQKKYMADLFADTPDRHNHTAQELESYDGFETWDDADLPSDLDTSGNSGQVQEDGRYLSGWVDPQDTKGTRRPRKRRRQPLH